LAAMYSNAFAGQAKGTRSQERQQEEGPVAQMCGRRRTNLPFGRELQLEREKRGVTLETVSDETRVSTRFLHALEMDDFASLPGGVFQRGIVRSYCRFLGLDEQEWLSRFASTAQAANGDMDWMEFAENVKRARAPSRSSMGPKWWGVALMLLGLLAAGWLTWHYVVQRRVHSDLPAALSNLFDQRQNVCRSASRAESA
jgi:cytoskeleton protein RodZ